MSSRIQPDVQTAYLNDVIVSAARQTGKPTDAGLASAVHGASRWCRIAGADSLEHAKLTHDEKAQLEGPAVQALADKYGRAWGVTAQGIRAALAAIPEHQPVQSIIDFAIADHWEFGKPIDWAKKAVYGPDETQLAKDSLSLRLAGCLPAYEVSGRPELAGAIRGLRYLEEFRDAIARNYVVAPGSSAPRLDTSAIALVNEQLTDTAKRAGYLDANGQIADARLVAALQRELPRWAGFIPYTHIHGVEHRGLASDAYAATVNYLIPAYLRALRSLGASIHYSGND